MNAPFPAVSAEFIIDLYHRYLCDPASVDPGWIPYFNDLYGPPAANDAVAAVTAETAAVRLIEAYRSRGHFSAKIDPLEMWAPPQPRDLLPEALGLDDATLNTVVSAPMFYGVERSTLRTLISRLQTAYAGSIGFDCAHVEDAAARDWFHHQAEHGAALPDAGARRSAVERLIEADEFEQFMNRRFVGKKRFGAEGAEAILPWFDAMLARSAALGVRDIVIGGTSRSRLNVMANIVGKPITAMFYEVKGHRPFPDDIQASGDVPYHFGYIGERAYGDTTVKLLYCHNPSHLEAVNGVTLGRVRARQRLYKSEIAGWRNVMGVTVHTDAAFAGQGVVGEVLQLNRVPAYRAGGSIRLVINNQVGFTTEPMNGRSSTYCTDIAKAVGAPVLHVNGDDIDAVVRCGQMAAEYRHRFGGDIVVDLVCYRRRGHNEVDEPTFTQPQMYKRVAAQTPVRQSYVARLAKDGVLAEAEEKAISRAYFQHLDAAYEAIDSFKPNRAERMDGGSVPGPLKSPHSPPATGLARDRLVTIGLSLSRPPAGVNVNPKIVRQLGERETAIRTGEGIAWPFGEALAYASLACEGVEVRVSGQDTPRGAFSQRHFVLIDQDSGAACEPLNMIEKGQARCEIIGSPLAEYAVLGFEYGYSLDANEGLTVWEAQFGDFANVAQVVIDQFVASANDKWLEPSGLTLLLPHGLEGQGPDHSSGRIERFLQLCAGDNLRVATCTTPANFFHLLRSQAKDRPRRPLVAFTPKSLLRDKRVVSRLDDFVTGTAFKPVIGPETVFEPTRRVVLCSGKIYYDLFEKLSEIERLDIAIVRLEQLYPFPEAALTRELARFPNAEVLWCQEEPQNMGAWSYLDRRIEKVLRDLGNGCQWPRVASRPENASTAIGTNAEHDADQKRLAETALTGH